MSQYQARATLPAVAVSSIAARRFTRQALEQWELSGAAACDDVLLVVDELVTNAVVHASGPITLALTSDDGAVRIEVTDSSSTPPSARLPSETSCSGRGLAIIDVIARRWGTHLLATGGKAVWADISIRSADSVYSGA